MKTIIIVVAGVLAGAVIGTWLGYGSVWLLAWMWDFIVVETKQTSAIVGGFIGLCGALVGGLIAAASA